MINITKPLLGEAEQRAASEVIASGWVTQGPRVAEFERAFAAYCGAKDAVAVSNCTTALHLAMIEAGVGPGDEVILPSMTFIATANVVLYCGARPVFCEVRAEDFNMDPDAIEPLITPRTKALLPVHQVGMPARMDRICAIAKAHGLVVVEDAACAAGASFQGHKIGKPFGKYVCFSFHPRKVITTGEGGMITTDDEHAASQFRLLRHHGMGVPDTARHGASKVIFESYLRVGYNYRMTDIQAAIGLEQLKRLDGIVAERRRRAAMYDEALRRLPGVQVPQAPPDVYFNYQNYVITLTDEARMSRDDLMQYLLDRGIATRRGIMTIHREPAYAHMCAGMKLPVTEHAADHSMQLPLFPQMTDEEQDTVIRALRAALGA